VFVQISPNKVNFSSSLVISVTEFFYRSNDSTNSVKALKEDRVIRIRL